MPANPEWPDCLVRKVGKVCAEFLVRLVPPHGNLFGHASVEKALVAWHDLSLRVASNLPYFQNVI